MYSYLISNAKVKVKVAQLTILKIVLYVELKINMRNIQYSEQ